MIFEVNNSGGKIVGIRRPSLQIKITPFSTLLFYNPFLFLQSMICSLTRKGLASQSLPVFLEEIICHLIYLIYVFIHKIFLKQ